MDTVTRPARNYEMMTILLPDMADEDSQAALEKVRGYITDVNGEIAEALTESPWGRRRLAYTIRHEGVDYRDGYYVVIHFSAQPTAINDIEREMKLDTNVIRYLLVMDDPKAGEKTTEQPETATEEADTTATEVPAGEATTEAPAAETTEAPAEASTDTEANEAPAERAETATDVEETAEAIEGEEEPAPADGAETEEATKES